MLNNNTIYTPAQRFWKLLSPDKKDIRNVYVYAIFNGLINLSLPLGIQAIVNLIQGGQMSTSWIVLVAIVVLGVAGTGVLQIFQLRIVENIQQRIFTRAAFEFAYRVPKIRMEALYRQYAPELMNRFFDVMSVQKGLSKVLIDLSAAVLQMLFGLILLSLYHPFFILFSLFLIVFVFLVFRLTFKGGLDTSLKESKFKYRVAYWLEELARTANTFKFAGISNLPLKRTDELANQYLEYRESHFQILVRQYSFMVIFKVIVVSGLLAIGGILVMEQLMNIGQFVAAEIIILLIMNSVEKLVMSMETIYDVLTGLEKIGQVTDLELENSEGADLQVECQSPGLKVELNNVSFAYPGNSHYCLDNINLTIDPGETIVLAGSNASGKSTLLQLLAGLYDVQKGSMSYHDLNITHIDINSLRAIIGDCLSQEQVFEGTVLDNVNMGLPNTTFDDVKWAIENVGLRDFVKRMEKGYETMLDPQGKSLPRSVTQRLLIARSIAHKPKLLLLEDTFEHIDEKDRNPIIDFLTDKTHGWTIVASSTDPYLARKADRIVVMKDRSILQIGTYEEVKEIAHLKNSSNA